MDDDVFTIGLNRALALLAEPKRSGRRQSVKRVIREIESGAGRPPLQVLEGRYGPYVTDGETNASIPKGSDPATLSLEDARALLEARRGRSPRATRRRRAAPVAKRRVPRAAAAAKEAVPAAAGATRAPAKRKPSGRKTVH